LNSSATTGDSTLDVVDGTVFPAAGDFRVLVDDELMLCTARSSNTLTVTRAIEGTTLASHAAAALISQVVSQGGVQRYLRDNDPLFDTTRAAFRIIDASQNRLYAADFTLHDYSGGSVAYDFGNSIVLQGGGGAYLTRPIPGGPTWTLSVAVRTMGTSIESYWGGAVIGVMDTGNQSVIMRYRSQEAGVLITHQNGSGGYQPGDIVGPQNIFAVDWLWMRITDPNDGSWHFQISDDGKHWLEVGSYGKSSYLGTVNRILFGHMDMGGAGAYVTLGAWDDGAGIIGS
ncbi:MAG: hypothetical protein ABSH20_31805, partial [Tepidisphaeraceae bacterium]